MGLNGSEDHTADTIAVGDENGNVVLSFPKSVSWVHLDPETARNVAEAIARAAYKAHNGFAAQPTKSMVSDNVRKKLHKRVCLILQKNWESGKGLDYAAQNLVDIVLSEVA